MKLIIAGTRPADISAIRVTAAPLAFGSISADRLALGRERHQLLAEHARAEQELAVGQRAGDRVLDRDAAHAMDLRRLDQRLGTDRSIDVVR